jgi:DnaJ-class molecular chaperone
MTKSLYDILNVSKDAGEDEIKKAYRKLSLQYHPDRNSGTEDKFKEINEANEILSDPVKREQYDMENSGMRGFGINVQEFHDINNVFQSMFGGGGGPNVMFHAGGGFPGGGFPGGGFPAHFFNQLNRPQPIIKTLNLTILEAFNGGSFPMNIEKWNMVNGHEIMNTETFNLMVPAGIDENEVIVLRDMGHSIDDNNKGDVKITIQINNDTPFIRQGMDLLYRQTITLKEALCGFKFDLKHLNQKTICLNNNTAPTVIKPKFKKIIPGLGMQKDGKYGNLIIEFDVIFPDGLTPRQIKQLNEIL